MNMDVNIYDNSVPGWKDYYGIAGEKGKKYFNINKHIYKLDMYGESFSYIDKAEFTPVYFFMGVELMEPKEVLYPYYNDNVSVFNPYELSFVERENIDKMNRLAKMIKETFVERPGSFIIGGYFFVQFEDKNFKLLSYARLDESPYIITADASKMKGLVKEYVNYAYRNKTRFPYHKDVEYFFEGRNFNLVEKIFFKKIDLFYSNFVLVLKEHKERMEEFPDMNKQFLYNKLVLKTIKYMEAAIVTNIDKEKKSLKKRSEGLITWGYGGKETVLLAYSTANRLGGITENVTGKEFLNPSFVSYLKKKYKNSVSDETLGNLVKNVEILQDEIRKERSVFNDLYNENKKVILVDEKKADKMKKIIEKGPSAIFAKDAVEVYKDIDKHFNRYKNYSTFKEYEKETELKKRRKRFSENEVKKENKTFNRFYDK